MIDENFESNKETKRDHVLYNRRYILIVVLSATLFLNGQIWLSVPSITIEMAEYLNKSFQDINWYSTTFPIIMAIEAIPSIYLPSLLGVKYCLITGSVLHFIATSLRCLSELIPSLSNDYKYGFQLVGCLFASMVQGFTLNLPPFLSHLWFPKKHRQISTSVPYSSNFLGGSFSFFYTKSILKFVETYYPRRIGILTVFATEWGISLGILVLAAIFSTDTPASPPDDDETITVGLVDDLKSWQNFKNAFRNVRSYLLNIKITLVFISFGMYYAVSTLFYTILSEITDTFLVDKTDYIIYIGSVAIIFAAISTFTLASIISKRGKTALSVVSILCFSICLIISIIFCVLIRLNKFTTPVMFILAIVYGAFAAPYNSLGTQQLVNLAPMAQPHMVSSISLIYANVFTAVLIFSIGYIDQSYRYFVAFTILIVGYIYGILVSIFINKIQVQAVPRSELALSNL